MRNENIKRTLLIVAGLSLSYPTVSHAYIDPGTGSFIIQMLIAGFLGAVFYARFYSKKAKEFFKGQWNKLRGVQRADPVDKQDGDEERLD